MTTARDIIRRSMLKIGALVKSEVPDDDEANDALNSLNDMIESWSNSALMVVARTWETFNLVSGTSSYLMGPGQAFNTIRPLQVLDGYITLSTIHYPVSVIGDDTYNSISYPSLQGIPEFINNDNGYPYNTIRIYPVPNSNYPLFLLTEKAVATIATLDTDVALPPGWKRALIYNLAIDLAPEYRQQVTPEVADIAASSLGLVKLAQARARPIDAYPRDLSVRNIYSGWRY